MKRKAIASIMALTLTAAALAGCGSAVSYTHLTLPTTPYV